MDSIAIGKRAFELTNQYRRANGLPSCNWNDSLMQLGAEHSKNMGTGVVAFGHDGFQNRIRRYPFQHRGTAENVSYRYGSNDVAKDAVDGWINSPGHRKNMLGQFNLCGVGVFKARDGKIYLTQLFALA
eukprot:gene3138-3923_t